MKIVVSILLLTVLFVGAGCTSQEDIPDVPAPESDKFDFCDILSNPEDFKSRTVKTSAIIRGYHSYILYSENCCAREKVVMADGIDFEMRRKMANKIAEAYPNGSKGDFSGEISFIGRIEENDLRPPYWQTIPKFKFTVIEIRNYKPNQDLLSSCLNDYGVLTIDKKAL